jgi:tetratricopeptide (TPR) repeat protein
LNPKDPHTLLRRGKHFLVWSKESECIGEDVLNYIENAFLEAKQFLKTDELLLGLSKIFRKTGELKKAQEFLRELCAWAPEVDHFQYLLGKAYRLDKQYGQADRILKPLSKRTKEDREAVLIKRERLLVSVLSMKPQDLSSLNEPKVFYYVLKELVKLDSTEIWGVFYQALLNDDQRFLVIDFLTNQGKEEVALFLDPENVFVQQSRWMGHFLKPPTLESCRSEYVGGRFEQLREAFRFFSELKISPPMHVREQILSWIHLFVEGAQDGVLDKVDVGQMIVTYQSVFRFNRQEFTASICFNDTLFPVALLLQNRFFHPLIHRNPTPISLLDPQLSSATLGAYREYLSSGKIPKTPDLLEPLFNLGRDIQDLILMKGCNSNSRDELFLKAYEFRSSEAEYRRNYYLSSLKLDLPRNPAKAHLALARFYQNETSETHLKMAMNLQMNPFEQLECGILFYQLRTAFPSEKESLENALHCLNRALQGMPDHETALELLGKVRMKRREWSEALSCYEQLYRFYPRSILWVIEYAKCLILTQQTVRAYDILTPWLEQPPQQLLPLFSFLSLQGYPFTIKEEWIPHIAEPTLQLLIQAEDWEQIDRFFKTIGEVKTSDLLRHCLSPELLRKQAEQLISTNLTEARKLAEKAYLLDHDDRSTLNLLADIYTQEGLYPSAANIYRKSLIIQDDPQIRRKLVLVLLKEAEKLKTEAQQVDPEYFRH